MAHPRDILIQLKAAPRKSLSQNFLTSPHWAERLAQLTTEPQDYDEVWEIGPGLGAITGALLENAQTPVRSFEYDKKLSSYLRETLPELHLYEGDFLKHDLCALLTPGLRVAVLSNLPYHLSSPILFRLAEFREHWVRMILTFQKEFAARLHARPGDDAYGSLSLVTQFLFDIEPIGVLPPGAFYPTPEIVSEALMLRPKKICPGSFEPFQKVVRTAFLQPRKKMINNLKTAFDLNKLSQALEGMGISKDARPENLTRQNFMDLTEALHR